MAASTQPEAIWARAFDLLGADVSEVLADDDLSERALRKLQVVYRCLMEAASAFERSSREEA